MGRLRVGGGEQLISKGEMHEKENAGVSGEIEKVIKISAVATGKTRGERLAPLWKT